MAHGQSIAVIAVLVFGAVYLLGAAIAAATSLAERRGMGRYLVGASQIAVQPISVVFALIVGFVAEDVGPTFDRAWAAVGIEAARLHEAVIVADALPQVASLAVFRSARACFAAAPASAIFLSISRISLLPCVTASCFFSWL